MVNIPFSISGYGVSLMDVSVSAVTNTVAYDSLGRQIAITDGRGNTTLTEYNSFGQRSASIDALGNRTSYAYDQFGNLAVVTDPLGNATVYEYDLRGRKTYEGGATYPVRYTYDIFGNKTTMTTYRDEKGERGTGNGERGDVTTWLYDEASGVMTNKVYADGKGPKYDYMSDGKLSRRIWARGIVTDYSYDGWGNLTNTVYSDNTPTISLVYDALGRQIEAHDAAGVTAFLYDSYGSLTNETVVGVAGTNTIERYWDEFGRTAGYALNGARQTTICYEPDKGRIATMVALSIHSPTPTQNSNYFRWTYLPSSDLKSSLAYPNGLTASWQYDANNQLLQVCNATPTNVISQYNYTYDAIGRRINISKTGTAFAQNDSVAYGYNVRSELTNAVAAVDSNYRYAYDFDNIGNRESSCERGTNTLYMANQLNQYTAIDDFTPQFDDDGNQTLVKTATGIWSVTYNGENRPVQWQCVSTNSLTPNSSTPSLISMSYDRMGRRVTKNDQRFVYDGYLQIADNSGNAYIWDPTEPVATRPLAWLVLRSLGEGGYYTHDGNKNVSEVVAENGALAAHYEYAPFGTVIAQRGASAAVNPWRFSSEYAEDDTATVYYNYRHYAPIAGRWLSRDPIEEAGSLNLYLSCKNMTILIHDFAGLVFNKALCLALQQEVQKLVDVLNHELKKYDPVLDGRGGFPFRHGNVEGVTKRGGHYKEIKNLQKAIKNRLEKWKDICSGGPPSCPPIIYPIWADQLSNQHIAEPVYNNSNQTVPIIGVDGGGLWGAIVGGMLAGAIAAAVAGNVGPQALVPEEIVTVPASAVVGAIVGVVGFVTN